MKKNAKTIIAVTVLFVLVIGAFLAWKTLKPQALQGSKTLFVTVVHADGSEKLFELKTDSESLRELLETEGIISGTESGYGLYVLTVDGETADESKQQWWCFTKSGETVMTGVDDTMITDGDCYEITLTTGW